MSLPLEIEGELHALLDLMLDDELSVDQQARLQAILRGHEEATAFYVAYMKLSADLYRLSEEQIPPAAEELAFIPSHTRSRFDWASTAVACLLLGFFGMILHGVWPNIKQHMPYLEVFTAKPLVVNYATVIEARRTTWSRGGAVPGQALGQATCVLDEGRVKLRLDSNVLADILGPATFRVDGYNQLHLDAGKVVAVVPAEAIGFNVQTPDANVVDLGTEFGVKVEDGRDTEVHVFKGRVEASLKVGKARIIALGQGEAARFTAESQTAEKLDRANLALFTEAPQIARPLRPTVPVLPGYFYEKFDGAADVDLAGLRPDKAFPGISWKGTRSAKADGTLRKEENVVALLPFVPEDGHRYTLSVKLKPSSTPQPVNSAFLLGFTEGGSLALHHKDSRSSWASMNRPIASMKYLSNHQIFTSTGGTVAHFKLEIDEPIETLVLQIILDTRAPAWKLEWHVGDKRVNRFTYPRNPVDIDHVSYGSQAFEGRISEFILQVD
jgi:ferric-dicitrate binding protein FerR (iron transport regulator)